MCPPLLFALAVGGAAMNATGLIMQGQGAKAQSEFDALLLERDATVASNDAIMSEYAALNDASLFRRKFRHEVSGKAGPTAAKSGVLIGGSGGDSFIENVVANAEQARLEELNILYRGSTAATALRTKSIGLKSAAGATRAAGKRAARAANVAAFGSFVTSVGTAGLLMPSSGSGSLKGLFKSFGSTASSAGGGGGGFGNLIR